jgi:hypothetical protein
MNANSSFQVVLSDDLLSHLRRAAQEKHVPLRWLVAGLICDTLETTNKMPQRTTPQGPSRALA